jgi:hypothetical protein
MKLRIKNWAHFQHFKDRRPPWVKLYRDLLDDVEWHELEPKVAKALVMIWLIASESDGVLPDSKKLAFRLRTTEKDTKDILSKLSHWLEQADIKLISTRYQDAPVADVSDHQETERETERETEDTAPAASAAKLPTCPHLKVIDLYAQHLPTLPQSKPELWGGPRAKDLKARWHWVLTTKHSGGERAGELYATNEAEALDWFGRYFVYVNESDFLTGRDGRWANCDLGWLVNAENFAKVLQGNYENKKVAA